MTREQATAKAKQLLTKSPCGNYYGYLTNDEVDALSVPIASALLAAAREHALAMRERVAKLLEEKREGHVWKNLADEVRNLEVPATHPDAVFDGFSCARWRDAP